MKAIALVAACAAIVGFAYGMHSPIVPVFAREELAADFSQVGVIGMANFLPYMLAPFFVGMMLDRTNKAFMLSGGISLNIFAIFMLSQADSVPETIALRGLAGIAHAMFWPSSEVLVSTNTTLERRVKWISIFIAAWIAGFMTGPLLGKLILDFFDYRVLFQLSAAAISLAIVPALLLIRHGRPVKGEQHQKQTTSLGDIKREFSSKPVLSASILYYAVTFGVTLAIYPAYMKDASISDQNIELLFFAFGAARFAVLPLVQKIAHHGRAALAMAVMITATGMAISFAFSSIESFAVALMLIGIGTSIFYPVTFNLVTKDAPVEKMGSRLGIYGALFGAGWTSGPIAVGISSDAFGPSSPYLAFFVIGAALASAIAIKKSS
jgi:DHA1 family multidrug resistance protein-like MFS transporter/DHA1 family quinolone resistance protein-like MFS transporter